MENARQQAVLMQQGSRTPVANEQKHPAASPPCHCTSLQHGCTPPQSLHPSRCVSAPALPHVYVALHTLGAPPPARTRSNEAYARLEYEDMQRQMLLQAKARFELCRNEESAS
eukprot:1114386-Pleurochrysis_carterae.AAC.1